jgi:hypothetical protein
MTDDYVRAKVAEALATAGNDRHDAQKLLITWAVRDQPLLLGMTKPHLKAIAAALVDHALRNFEKETAGDPGPDHFPPSAIEEMIAGSNAPKDRRIPRNIPPPKSTERHASTMRKLAAAFTKKKKK